MCRWVALELVGDELPRRLALLFQHLAKKTGRGPIVNSLQVDHAEPSGPSNRRWWIVGLLSLAVLVNYIDRNNLSVAAVPVMDEFGFSPSAAGALVTAFFWTYTFLQIPSGWAVDRFVFRWTYGVAFLVWSLSSAAIGLARSFGQIFSLRMILGASQAAAQPVSLTYIRTHFTEREQGLPTGLYISGMMIRPAVGGFLGDSFPTPLFGALRSPRSSTTPPILSGVGWNWVDLVWRGYKMVTIWVALGKLRPARRSTGTARRSV